MSRDADGIRSMETVTEVGLALACTLDGDRRVHRANREWTALELDAGELEGKDLMDLIAAEDQPWMAASLAVPSIGARTFELRLLARDGSLRPALVRLRSDGGAGWELAAILLDGTGPARANRSELTVMRAASRLLARTPDALVAGIRSVLAELGEMLELDGAFVLTLEDGRDELWRVADWVRHDVTLAVGACEQLPPEAVQALINAVTRERALVHREGRPNSELASLLEALCAGRDRALLVLPLFRGSRVRGLCGLAGRRCDRDWTLHDLELAATVVEFLAVALERRSIETELLASEERFRNIVHESPMGMHVYELGPDGKLVLMEANAAAERITRTTSGSRGNTPISEAFPGLDATVRERFRLAAALGIPAHFPELSCEFDDRIVTLELHAFQSSPGRVAATFSDVSERRRTEAALRASEQRLRAIFEGAANVAFVITDASPIEPRIIEFSPGAETIFGHSRAEVIDQPLGLLHGEDEAATLRVAFERMGRGLPGFSGELSLRRRSGEPFPAQVRTYPLRDEAGRMSAVLGVGFDVSEQRRLESFLQQAQKMEALGTLAGGVAHDFNNILGAVMGYTELAQLSLPRESVVAGHLAQVLVAATRASELVRQILAFSRRSDQEVRPIDIGPIVREGLKMLRASIPRTIEIHQDVAAAAGTVLADPTQIHQVLMNLATNAAHAMRETGGVLTIEVDGVEFVDAASAPLPDCPPGTYVRLTVSDTGHGITSAHIDRIFDPYFTTKAKGVGTGLGLAVVHGIVKSCGGAIGVRSRLGTGTTFDVLLPRVADAPIARTAEIAQLPRGLERVLYVDDEVALVSATVLSLGRLGYRAVGETSPSRALERVRQDPQAFDLVITDQTMQGMTGDRLVRELVALRPDLPIVMCTGYSEALTEEVAASIGACALLEKPIPLGVLAQVVRQSLDRGKGSGSGEGGAD